MMSADTASEIASEVIKKKELKKKEGERASQLMRENAKAKAKAKVETLPLVLETIEKAIRVEARKGNKSILFRMDPWMNGELLGEIVRDRIIAAGFSVEFSHEFATTGTEEFETKVVGSDSYTLDVRWS